VRALGSIALAVTLLGCSDRASSKQATRSEPQRRVIEPPSGTVRPMPPHAIRSDGVGPYKLGDRLSSLLAQLASGPRMTRLEIPGLLHLNVIGAEDDLVLIGGESSASIASTDASFLAVVGGAEVARTEKGDVHVGSSRAELERELGPFVVELDRARDPRVVVPNELRNARVIVERDRVSAIVVIDEPPRAAAAPPVTDGSAAEPVCERPASTERAVGACLLAGTRGELVERERDKLIIRSIPTDTGEGKSRVVETLPVPNLQFVAIVRHGNERDELVAITRTDDPQERIWSLVAYRFEAKQIVRTVDPEPLYKVSAAQTRWIGAELQDVDLFLEVTSRPDGIEVGGLLTTRPNGKLRDVVVISPVVRERLIPRRHGKSATSETSDAGPDGRPGPGSAKP
jgi:hypothetical protein